ncbi:hypothetical protein [Pseudoalteromonas rubra]|uniref:Uncharacterized protein n=1 Tax=Pseudoalteromonas rubra TaxID=43658 RepID=A0A5S3X3Z3_9GAMM|nr:hypothetical protein [Pseudoalteromonas rubra]TMP38132.1 hypothetical protein CWB98_07380 [Pseudoalteromonas rubra]
MKYLTTALISLFLNFFVEAGDCKKIYSNEHFYLCTEDNVDGALFPFPVYDVYAVHLKTGNKSFIAYESFVNDVSKITKVSNDEFFYKAYMGGNSPPSENRHVLLVINQLEVKNAGVFSGYEDIDNDGKLDYFLLSLSESGSASAFDTYTKSKLILKSNELVRAE